MVAVADPVGAGLVTSLARPGGNVTGNSSASVEVAGKSLELLKEVAPERRRVGILWNPANSVFQTQMRTEAEAASRRLGLQAHVVAASDAMAIDRAFEAFTRERAEAVAIPADPIFVRERSRIAGLAAKRRLPSVGGIRQYAEAGGLVAYGPDFYELYRERRHGASQVRGVPTPHGRLIRRGEHGLADEFFGRATALLDSTSGCAGAGTSAPPRAR
jgi:putative tryptophan/tyrosine transport system substrate-binding protein